MSLRLKLSGDGRRRIAEAVTLCALAAGAWYFLVRPREHAVVRKQQDIALMRDRIDRAKNERTARGMDADMVRRVAAAHEVMRDWIEPGRSASAIYEELTGLVRDNGLRLVGINPTSGKTIAIATAERAAPSIASGAGGRRAAAASRNASRRQTGASDAKAEVVGYRLALSGDFASIMRFVQECEDLLPATRVVGMSLSAGQQVGAGLEATIETAHLNYQPAQTKTVKSGKGGST
jgi:hypothetical protein